MGDQPNAEEVKGRLKEAAGTLTGQEDMEEEGEAQRQKGEAEQEAREKQAEAIEAERRQKGHQ